jgi:hypothetical protein
LYVSVHPSVANAEELITSFDSATTGSGNVVNEVFVLYNGFGQAIETYQSHAGAVNLSTTPSVQMAYADGSAITIRPTGITYPIGRPDRSSPPRPAPSLTGPATSG